TLAPPATPLCPLTATWLVVTSLNVTDSPPHWLKKLTPGPLSRVPFKFEISIMIGRSVGRFRILAALGSGGMASVWKAEDCLLGREVALKILSDELAGSAQARKRFLREARSNATLDHPGVPAIFDFGESDGCVYLAMALIDGQTLSERATSCPMAISEACRVVADAARTLAHAHSAGIIHRDVTGRNIMIARDGRVFVLDFGLALAAGESRITSTNTVIGTPAYLAPEVTLGETADARSDIYGLGVILFEALTGALPFESESRHGLRRAVHVDPPSPRSRRPDIPAELDRIV